MTSTSAERVALILDCLGHEDTDLAGQPRLWRHSDGRYLTEDEAAMIAEAKLVELRRAMNLWDEEIEQLREHSQLIAEFDAIISPYSVGPGDRVRDIIARLPVADAKRAAGIWQRVGPEFEAWLRDR